MVKKSIVLVIIILLTPLTAISKQDTSETLKGSVTPDMLSKGEVMEFNVVKDLSAVEFIGTSFMHHFRGVTHEIEGFTKASFNDLKGASCEISIPVSTIDGFALGGKKEELTRNIHTNLEADKYPDILFKMRQARPEKIDLKAGKASFLVEGDLTIHNVTRTVIFPVDLEVKDGLLHLTGRYNNLNMRNYGVEPKPLVAFIKVRDLVDVKFDIYEDIKTSK